MVLTPIPNLKIPEMGLSQMARTKNTLQPGGSKQQTEPRA